MIWTLIPYGDNLALIIDKSLLLAVGLDVDKALFQITVDPSGGILIRSVREDNEEIHKVAFSEVLKENDELMRGLSK